MRPVRFTRGTEHGRTRYNAGESACFHEGEAARLVSLGCAVYADGAPTSEAAPKAEAATPPPSSTTATWAASTLASSGQTPEGASPSPAREAADVRADNVSRPQREQHTRRHRR